MPHDMNGHEIKVDDIVVVPCRVLAARLTRDYCNVDLETAVGMTPSLNTVKMTLNSQQVICESLPAAPDVWLNVIHAIGVDAMTAQSDPHADATTYRKALVGICNMALKAQETLK